MTYTILQPETIYHANWHLLLLSSRITDSCVKYCTIQIQSNSILPSNVTLNESFVLHFAACIHSKLSVLKFDLCEPFKLPRQRKDESEKIT